MAGALAGGGGALLSASLQALFDRMASGDVLTFLRGQKLSDTLLKKLKMKFLAVKGVLNDAEAKQIMDSDVNDWVDELKDVVYDAEDLLDDIATEALRCKIESDSHTQVRNINFCEGIKSRVEDITGTLERLAQEKDVLGLKEGGVGDNLSNRWPTTCLVDESGVYGRDDNREKIVEFLRSYNASGNKIGVIALVGMGGIGKTTLAQLVYKDRRVVDCFDLKAWVCVSEEFDLVRITKTILKAITSGTSTDDNDLNLLQCKLEERLSRKKFLLVLDDVWNENYNDLESLQLPFSAGLQGSRIIVTTRSGEVARVMRSIRIHHVGRLSPEDCWSLFAKHAFENGDSSPHPKLEEIGKEIVKRCKGLPLAAKTLGSALYSELRVEEWENLLNSEIWDLPNDQILPALWLSYAFLPPHLKRCFAYCSIFPKDYEFEKENLILLWMAEGFLQQSDGKKTIEKVGEGYFHGLLSRSFFQNSGSHKSYFIMYDLINDLAQVVSGKFCVQLKDGNIKEIPEKLRHLSYFRSEYDRFERFETLDDVSGLRTFLPLHLRTLPQLDKVSKKRDLSNSRWAVEFRLSNRVWNDLLPTVQYLRVLSLCYYEIPDLPDSIGDLKHLRYLDLTYALIKRLPDSICSLYNLQTLILYFCRKLVELPKMMCKMISLRHLDIRHSKVKEIPSQMGLLKSLQKLSDYIVGKESGTRVGELRELSQIGGSLVIQGLQNVVDAKDALQANLVKKQYLDELELEWDSHGGDDQNGANAVLNNLQPHSNLKRLTIYRYGGSRFPDWFGGSSILNMVSLRLWDCDNVSAFPPLGQLPSLKHLYIVRLRGVERVGAEFYGAEPSFVSLKALSFKGMSKWKEWSCLGGHGGEFPRLKELYIEDCPMLTGDLPTHLPLLTKLEIEDCEELVAPLPRVPAIHDMTTRSRDISQWKELPPLLKMLSITNSDSLESLLEEGMLQNSTSVDTLKIRKCSFSRPLCRVCLPITLKLLIVRRCKKLEFLLPEFFKCHHPSLRNLIIEDGTCNSFLSIPLGNFPRCRFLEIGHLKGLELLSISTSDGDPPSSSGLIIYGCPNLVSICCKNMEVACFRSLTLDDCPELIFPIQGLPSSLTSLSIMSCNKFTSQVEFGLQGLPSLTSLTISGLSNLISLDLQLLTSLRKLEIRDCPKLQSLTEERLPTSLSLLLIHSCPLLKDRCKFWTGQDWSRIAHIQSIVIDDQIL